MNPQLEMIAVCDPQGRPTGEARSRQEIHSQGLWHRTAHIWLLDQGGRTLLQKRSPSKENYPDCWDISSAGHVSATESTRQGALRELREELGLVVQESDLVLFAQTQGEQILHNGAYIDREFHDVFLVHVKAGSWSPRFQDGEVSASRWIDGPRWEQELRAHPERFSPHPEEYPLILRLLGAHLLP